ncbi:MAG: aminotransferase class V-fold PLP-dependent enzyme [Phycisphaerales bacterium]|nr:MAG: aminotransferase class V-fold PLP-dependent enzyme [Phycisphaerales bacterium]
MDRSRRLYFDNAATSFPKPPRVLEAMRHYAEHVGASPGRGGYAESLEGTRVLRTCRERINRLIHGSAPERVVFTLNTTDALHLAIAGVVRHRRRTRPGSRVHLVTTAMDHNSVLRPFNALAEDGDCVWTCVPVDPETGLVDPEDVRAAIGKDTALVAVVHASNVSGTVQPIAEIGAICRDQAVPFLVDAAQSVGHIPIDVEAMGVDLLAFPGHKGLLGPLGTGVLYLRPGMERVVATVREGGTGSLSELDTHPGDMPDRYEAGSHNTVGLAGLSEGVAWILERGVDRLWAHERGLIETMIASLNVRGSLERLRLLGPQGVGDRLGVFSLAHDTIPARDLADRLENEFGILARAGIHCAPRAHASLGSESGGALRLSVGPFISPQDVRYACDALEAVCAEAERAAGV